MALFGKNAEPAEEAPVSGGSARWIDPDAVLRIRSLELRARIVVEGLLTGLHRSPYHGFSVEFSEYREYTPGDDPRYLDWRLFARSDRYYVKRFEDETNARVMLLVDMSRSMNYGSLSYSKVEYARTAAATLAFFLIRQRDAVGALTFDEQIGSYLPPRYRPGQLHRVLVNLEQELPGKSTNLAVPLEQVAKTVTKRGIVVLISDLLAPIDTLETHLSFLRAAGHEVIVWRMIDPAEIEFDFDQPKLFVDLENQKRVYIDPQTAKKRYLERFAEHAERLEEICSKLGVEYRLFRTDEPLELTLFQFLSSRLHNSKAAGRKPANVS